MHVTTFIKYVARPILVTQACVILALICLATWDVSHNLIDYLYDNHVTFVQLVTGNDAINALPNLSLAFYWESAAGFWKYPNGTDDLARLTTDDEIRRWVENAPNDDISALAGCAFFMDNKYVLTSDYHIECNTTQYGRVLGIDTNLTEAVDRALASFDSKITSSIPRSFVVDQLTPWSVTLTVPMGEMFEDFEYEKVFYLLRKNESGVSYVNPSFTINDTPYDMKAVFQAVSYDTINVRLQVFTSGFYDIREIHSSCVDDANSDRDAVWMCRLRMVARICNCIPFTLRRLFKHATTFCTEDIYEHCWSNLSASFPDIISKCQLEKACMSRNYQIYASVDSYQTNHDYWFNLKITRSISSISQFRESHMTSLPQLLSQIGGSLGLYLGFSCFTVWQLFVLGFKYFTANKRNARRQSRMLPLMSMWIQAVNRKDPAAQTVQQDTVTELKDLRQQLCVLQAAIQDLMDKHESASIASVAP